MWLTMMITGHHLLTVGQKIRTLLKKYLRYLDLLLRLSRNIVHSQPETGYWDLKKKNCIA